jgi:hypothetical protein
VTKASSQNRHLAYPACFLVISLSVATAQSNTKMAETATDNAESRTTEDLNRKGGDAAMPPFSGSVIHVEYPFRTALLSKAVGGTSRYRY